MNCRTFTFDLVILNVWLDNFDYENNTLTVEVNFNGNEFSIESNPEKPGEFKQGRTCEFQAYGDDLALELMEKPLTLRVLANAAEQKGDLVAEWPRELLEKLERPDFSHFSHFDECDLKLKNVITGKVSLQYRLRVKCEFTESDGDEEEEKRSFKNCRDIKEEIKRIADPNALFFLIQNDSDVCDTINDVNSSCRPRKQRGSPTALDLSQFRSFHGTIVKDTDELDKVYAPDCCHSKKMVIPECPGKPKCGGNCPCPCPNPCPKMDPELAKKFQKCYSSGSSSTKWACKAKRHVKECPHSDKFSEETTEGTCSTLKSSDMSIETESMESIQSEVRPCRRKKSEKNQCEKMSCPKPRERCPRTPPELTQTVCVRDRFCPICKSDVSWLPKLAACPKCGYKPTPYTVEKPYNENLTAEQILTQWTSDSPKPKQSTTQHENSHKKSNRCTCKDSGKPCAHCRIRQICKDFLKPKSCHGPNDKDENKSKPPKEKTPSQICQSNSEEDSRTHLAKLFSELKDLYNLRVTRPKQELTVDQKCEDAFNTEKTKKSKHKKRSESESRMQKKNKLKKSIQQIQEAKKKLCRKKIYNYKAVRKYPGCQAGHKDCVSSGKIVPKHMGWLWTANTMAVNSGWKPGAIRKPIKEMMKYFLKDYPADTLNVSKYARKCPKKPSEELIQKPTLHICKKNGAYLITMRPIKDASLLKHCADPYVNMKPIQFKIVQNPFKQCVNEIKKVLKKKFEKCTCKRPVAECFCRTYLDKKRLEYELNKACRQRGMPCLKDTLVLSDTSESETEFDFGVTPPAGVIKPHLKHKPDLACRETQYNEDDWIIKPPYPRPLNKYMKPFDATGGRTLPPPPPCPALPKEVVLDKCRKLPLDNIKGGIGGCGGVGGNQGLNRYIGGGMTNKPLLFNLIRRGKPEPCICSPCIC